MVSLRRAGREKSNGVKIVPNDLRMRKLLLILDLVDGRSRIINSSHRSDGVQIQENQAESTRRQPISSPRANFQPVNCSRSDTQSPQLCNRETVVSPETVSKNSIPLSPRLNLFRNRSRTPKGCCAICLEMMKLGTRHAIFTMECSHSFHFPCIVSNVRHENLICPVCQAKWKEVPWQVSVKEAKNNDIDTTAITPIITNGNLHDRRWHNIIRDQEVLLRTAEEKQRRLDPVLIILDDSITSFRLGHRQDFTQELAVYDDHEPLDSNLRPNEGQTSLQNNDGQEFEFKGFIIDREGTSVQLLEM